MAEAGAARPPCRRRSPACTTPPRAPANIPPTRARGRATGRIAPGPSFPPPRGWTRTRRPPARASPIATCAGGYLLGEEAQPGLGLLELADVDHGADGAT